jgi:hypothetical protein
MFNRRNNCCHCGGAFCAGCASNKHRFNESGAKTPAPTCNDCHKILCKKFADYLTSEDFKVEAKAFGEKFTSSAVNKANDLYGSLNYSEGPMPSKEWAPIMKACGSHLAKKDDSEESASYDSDKFVTFCIAAFGARVQQLQDDFDHSFGITGF